VAVVPLWVNRKTMVLWRRNFIFLACMLATSGLAIALRPTPHKSFGHRSTLNLESLIPAEFGDWHAGAAALPIAPSPELQAMLDQTYDQTLSRTYIDQSGQRIMLSIAFSGDYGKGTQYHRPEVCYPSQGFQILKETFATLVTTYGDLPVKHLVAVLGSRNEPITYWFVVGGQQTQSSFGVRLAQIKIGLTGHVPDGLLIRVSSIDQDEAHAFLLQESFIKKMLEAIDPIQRGQVTGKHSA
jgi:EpsI family protein